MDSIYVSIGKHIKEYRLNRSLTQQQVADMISVSGNYYGKVERGTYSLSYNMLSYIYTQFGWDIDYILTGSKKEENPFVKFIQQCPGPSKEEFIILILWALDQKIREIPHLNNVEKEDYRKKLNVTRLCYQETDQKAYGTEKDSKDLQQMVAEDSVLYHIRTNHNLTNQTMADELNLSLRSYDSIEKGRSKPGIETFVIMDRKFGYNPSFMLTGEFENLSIVNEIWNQFSDSVKEEITKFLKSALSFIQN